MSKNARFSESRLTLEGLQEQLVVGLNVLQVRLLGCSHRRRGRLVQAVSFAPRSKSHRGVSSRGVLLLWSHRPPKTAQGKWNTARLESSSFVKTKEARLIQTAGEKKLRS